MRVDDRKIILVEPHLTTYSLQAKLTAKLQSTDRRIIFYLNGETIAPRLFNHYEIQEMKASDSGLEISYLKDRTHQRTYRLNFTTFDRKLLVGRINLSSTPAKEAEPYHFLVEPQLQEIVRSRLTHLSDSRYKGEKGDISEEIQRYLLSILPDWEEVADHPFNEIPEVVGSRRTGPDSVQRLRSSAGLEYQRSKPLLLRKESKLAIS